MTNRQIQERPSAGTPISTAPLANFGGGGWMEHLLIHCAEAIESNDNTLTQQIMWVLHTVALADGDTNQRLAAAFLRALLVRAAAASAAENLRTTTHRYNIRELSEFVGIIPWHRFGFAASNAALTTAMEGYSEVHLVYLSTTHCIQIPTLIDAIASYRSGPPPLVKLTVPAMPNALPPLLDLPIEDIGARFVTFARSRGITLKFTVVPSTFADGFASLIGHLQTEMNLGFGKKKKEAIIVNCHIMLHYIPEETSQMTIPGPSDQPISSPRTLFIRGIRALDPALVVMVEEDADFTSTNLAWRLRSAFHYLWSPYDAVGSFLGRQCRQRQWYEEDMRWRIENVVAEEGDWRVERQETRSMWARRMRGEGFRGVPLPAVAGLDVRCMLNQQSTGWVLSEEGDDGFTLGWKGQSVVFAAAWVPSD